MIDVPKPSPDLGGDISAALRDTWPAMQTWLAWLIAVVVGACIGGIGVIASGLIDAMKTNPPGQMAHPEYFMSGEPLLGIAVLVGAFFALASAVRTVRPDFRMTVGRFFGFLGYGILCGLIIAIGFICLVIPGFYLAVKLSPAPYIYLLGEGDPLKKSWEITKGRFWWTVLAFFVIGLCSQVGLYAIGIVGAIVYFIPFAIFAFIPIFVAMLFAVYQFQYNAYMRWFDNLLKTA